MKMKGKIEDRPWRAIASPWVIIGSALFLALIVIVLAFINHNREKRFMAQILQEKGAVYIKAFEAGTRTGMRGMLGQGAEIQTLLEELAQYPDVKYLFVTNNHGRILADSDPDRIDGQFADFSNLSPENKEKWRIVQSDDGKRSFEVYKKIFPLEQRRRPRRGGGRRHEGERCLSQMSWPCLNTHLNFEKGILIFVGLDIKPFEEARLKDTRMALVIIIVLVLLGFGGVVSLFWAQNYRLTRSLMLDARAFASEVVANMPAGLIVTDQDGRIVNLNEVGERILKQKRIDILGKPLKEVLPPDFGRLAESMKRGENVLEKEMEIELNGEGTAPLSVSASGLTTEEGKFIGHIFMLRDLGEIRFLQNEVRRREKLAALGNLAAGVAHEIRNPLSSIKGYATYFGGRFPEGSEDRKAAAIMAGEVERLNKVITELLEFARPSELKPTSIDPQKYIEDSVRLIRQDAAAKKIEVKTSIEPGLPEVFLDADRLNQALLNIYINAVQSMPEGGLLTIKAGRAARGRFKIEIADTGSGIKPDDLSEIFNPYFTTKPRGTGLGLAIVHKIIEAHSGTIKVASRAGRGSVFTLTLPISQEFPRPKAVTEIEF